MIPVLRMGRLGYLFFPPKYLRLWSQIQFVTITKEFIFISWHAMFPDIPSYSKQVMKIGIWRDSRVCLRRVPQDINFNGRSIKITAINLKTSISHPNVLKFFGITEIDDVSYIVSEYPEKGSLVDILQSSKYNLGENWKFSIALDIANGMDYLHKRGLVHGHLTSDACVLDGRWSAKVMDWEYLKLYAESKLTA